MIKKCLTNVILVGMRCRASVAQRRGNLEPKVAAPNAIGRTTAGAEGSWLVGIRCCVSAAQRRSILEPWMPHSASERPTAAEHRGPKVGRFKFDWVRHLGPCVEYLFPFHIDGIDDANDHRVHWRTLHVGRQPSTASLTEKHHLAHPRADAVDGHDGVFTGPKLRRILVIDQLGTQQ
jgi:hypothetical protein